MKTLTLFLTLALTFVSACASTDGSPTDEAAPLQIYFMDVEGGQATLMVGPTGESLLVDTGWPGTRDANRIVAAAREAGVDTIDHLVITHFHDDHVGGLEELVRLLPIRSLRSHGPASPNDRLAQSMVPVYRESIAEAGLTEQVAQPGDIIPVEGLEIEVLTSARQLLAEPLPGAGGPNPLCEGVERRREDRSDNSASVGMMVRYGEFRFLDIGDVTQDLEYDLACPINRIGEVDLYLTTHHGSGASNAEVLVHSLRPRVAIMNNGAKKGGTPEVIDIVRRSPGLEDFWMVHFSEAAGEEGNVAPDRIANLTDTPGPSGEDEGWGFKVVAYPDGSFSVTNARTGETVEYR